LKFEPDAKIGQISADFEKCRFEKASFKMNRKKLKKAIYCYSVEHRTVVRGPTEYSIYSQVKSSILNKIARRKSGQYFME